jgi:hypothetical protein
MISGSTDDEFTRLIYRALRYAGPTNNEPPSLGPSSSCSAAALMAGEALSPERRRHVETCSFCARLAIRLDRTRTIPLSLVPPSLLH